MTHVKIINGKKYLYQTVRDGDKILSKYVGALEPVKSSKKCWKINDGSWDFRGHDTKYSTHRLHTYPAMMIPQIADRLISTYINEGKTILDPFCGSGTVLVEALRKNRMSYGIDINPLARLLSKVKTTPIEPNLLKREADKLLDRIRNDIWLLNMRSLKVECPSFFNIDFWYRPEVTKKLTIVKNEIDQYKMKDKDLYDFFLIIFSEIVRLSSNTKRGEFKLCRIPELRLNSYNPDVFRLFEAELKDGIVGMEQLYAECKNGKNKGLTAKSPKILDEDTRNRTSLDSSSIDLIVTSPPYGDSRTTVAYGQFSRLSLQWLGFDQESVTKIDKVSLGGIKYKDIDENGLNSAKLDAVLDQIEKRDQKRAMDVYSFYMDFNMCLVELERIMNAGSFLCMVVGNRTVKEIQIPTDEILIELGRPLGLKHEKTFIRNIPNKRMPMENSPTNVKGSKGKTMHNEYIVMLQKRL